eukprot:TRINITY_DN226_c0_g2_i1.p1 TRINITY_DN226_c0_g2~~TRINITY_DN226_c0_g2_i1.p1  ORF type:complete len:1084 (+),score=360.82 TRINITY_DN226_c0_g2_i1:87-3338(+)
MAPALFKKARAGLLGGLRDGTLERLVNEMEDKAGEEAETAPLPKGQGFGSVLKKAKGNLLNGLRDGSLARIVDEMEENKEEDKAAVEDAFTGFEELDLPIKDFVDAFQNNPGLVRRIAVTTGMPEEELKSLAAENLFAWFEDMDTDKSGTVSYDEFVEGLTDLRGRQRVRMQTQEVEEQKALIDEALEAATVAFDEANLGAKEDLTLEGFVKAILDPVTQETICKATSLPFEFFDSLGQRGAKDLFHEIDTDKSGSVSFNEWVSALVRIRLNVYEQQKQEEAEALDAVTQLAEDAIDEADEDWSGEFDFKEFLNAFKFNSAFVRKVSRATGVSELEFRQLADEDIGELFNALDTDFSGTVSFDEFVTGLIEIRKARQEEKRLKEMEERQAVEDEAFMEAFTAFEDADFEYTGELTLDQFVQAFTDPIVIEKIQFATKVPVEFFERLDMQTLKELFDDIDDDKNGTVSQEEWVRYLVKVRMDNYEQEKAEEAEATEAVMQLAEDALMEADDDWNGEMDFNEFVEAFLYKPRFVRKVSMATGVPVEEFSQLQVEDLRDLFEALDEDFSGTISFDEFVKGLVEIRQNRKYEAEQQAALDETIIFEQAIQDASQAFEEVDSAYKGELDLKTFTNAMRDPNLVEKVAMATKLPLEYFKSLSDEDIKTLFEGVDEDQNGTVSFEEWVSALVRTRLQTYAQEKEEQAEAMNAVGKLAEQALEVADEDWSGEFDFWEFMRAFRCNETFLHKISLATGVAIDDFRELGDEDLESLFDALDTDFSGTVSFQEFCSGLMEIRIAQQHNIAARGAAGGGSGKKKKKEKPYVYQLPAEIKQLPALSDKEKAHVNDVLAKFKSKGLKPECVPHHVAMFLEELSLPLASEKIADGYIKKAFPGRDLAVAIKDPDDWYVLYQVALSQQPVWTKPLTKSASATMLTAKDMQKHESTMRAVYNRYAGDLGAMKADDMGNFFVEAGLAERNPFTPRAIQDFKEKHKTGTVYFPEVVDLCNNAISGVLKDNLNPKLAGLEAKYPKRAYALAPLNKSVLGNDAAGSPAFSRRRQKRGGINWADRGRSVVAGMGRSASHGTLSRW